MKMMIRCVLGRLRKRQSEVALPQTLSRLFHLVKYGRFLWHRILKDCIKVQKKKKEIVASCSSHRQNVNLGPVYMEWGTPGLVGLVSFVFTL